MYTLGIETSCDETSCAILKKRKVLSNSTISSLKEHVPFGGVIPEIATRAHLKNIDKVVTFALAESGVPLSKVGLIAATNEPGLIGALLVGLNFAKGLSLSLSKPFIAVNHLQAHLFAPFLNDFKAIPFPFLGVVVSGGHTQIYRVNSFSDLKIIGTTRDDACGEVYDKIARNLNLGYPGGPVIDRLFDESLSESYAFKCGRIGLDLSFSGIKTAVVYKKMELQKQGFISKRTKIKLISSFQRSAIGALVDAVEESTERTGIKTLVFGGGVVANSYLRKQLKVRFQNLKIILPDLEYAGDNAAMVAGLGFYLYNEGS
ncbi:MAG: tRNA (adenosine(37)-N6)-threonylcarbamoyltransferase complex transferase subunit TsaD [Candidatus Omnitrophica bacterium]|nr:tRNA (adenosine(37)-N6)-threonylcarbamoyltransferase complex transferase subunit TsaD [Candidatus Omnitrophota bacterium]